MMSRSNATHAALFFLLIFSMASYCMGRNTIFCPEIEKHSLLTFKQSLDEPRYGVNLLSSWDGKVNCCEWKGVVCNNFTGHVHQLHLQSSSSMFHPTLLALRQYAIPSISDYPSVHVRGLKGRINPSLLTLKHLRYLDLSGNNFGVTIPSFIGSFTNLEHLNLSNAGFHGKIPRSIGNLSKLHTLDLDGCLGLAVDGFEWLSGLSRLKYLNMNGVDLSKANNWVAQVINTLPSLLELHLSYCSLDFKAPLNDVNITSLTSLDLSFNYAKSSTIPKWIFQLSNLLVLDLRSNSIQGPIPTISNATKLQCLDLSGNNFRFSAIPRWVFLLSNLLVLDLRSSFFEGQIPTTSNATKLQHFDLSYNYFNSSIPDWLYFCKDLEFIDLSHNFFHGPISNAIANLTSLNTLNLIENQLSGNIPREIAYLCKIQSLGLSHNELRGKMSDSFGNMSECFLGALEFLDLRSNKLFGHLTNQFGEFRSLQSLDLRENLLSGGIPSNLGKLSSLKYLWLYDNKLTGNLPESLGQLSTLERLEISDNMLEGVVTEIHFAKLTNLEFLFASGNHLTLNISPNWIPPFQLITLKLGSWNLGIGSPIPSWLEMQKNIRELDLSNTGISGNIPNWIWERDFLNLSHNHLCGEIPYIRGPYFTYLSSNQFSGSLPRIADNVLELDLSNNSFSGGISHFLCDKMYETYELWILHLGGNRLRGGLPDCWMKWPSLTYLNLGSNNMVGTIPNSIGYLENLLSLNLYNNQFSGQIPFSMHNCTKLVKIDLSSNGFVGKIPTWMGTSLVNLRILILRSNKFSGKISSDICHLNSLQILDLSDNKFSGTIPRCIDNFTAMATKRSLSEDYAYKYGTRSSDYSDSYTIAIRESALVGTKGTELHYDTILPLVTNIDLSKNNLSGDVPKELASLVELRSLNLSENHLTGLIPDNIGDMRQLESLDFSRNSLSGQIPHSFSLLSSLNYLNLSCNKLTGRIPESTQILGFGASSFTENNLCGPPLTSDCGNDAHEVHGHEEDNERDKSKIEWLYVFLSLGYAVGFSVVCTTLVLKKSWREAFFGLIEYMWNKVYVYVLIKWTKLTKSSSPS